MDTRAILAATMLAVMASPAYADSLQDFWRKQTPSAVYASNKSALALEMCLGLGLSEYGPLTTLHGEQVTLVSVIQDMGPGVLISIKVTDRGGDRELAVAARGSIGSAWQKRGARVAETCI